jgi:hypothetical protein
MLITQTAMTHSCPKTLIQHVVLLYCCIQLTLQMSDEVT